VENTNFVSKQVSGTVMVSSDEPLMLNQEEFQEFRKQVNGGRLLGTSGSDSLADPEFNCPKSFDDQSDFLAYVAEVQGEYWMFYPKRVKNLRFRFECDPSTPINDRRCEEIWEKLVPNPFAG
jgi:hypothetical protein